MNSRWKDISVKSNKAIRFLAGFILALAPAIPSMAQEARCNELGSTCTCSEPLDFSSNGDLAINTDPPDSVTRECNSGKAITLLSGARVDTVSASSTGLSGPSRVLRRKSGSGSVRHVNQDFPDSTYCMRVYFREDAATYLPATGGEEDLKFMLAEKPNQTSVAAFLQFRAPGLQCGTTDKRTGWHTDSTVFASSGDSISMEDCSDRGWCRAEMCFDHNWDGTDRLRWRCRVDSLGTGKTRTWSAVSTNSQSTVNSGERAFPVRLFSDYGPGGWERYFSHVMIATKRPADPSFWIGRAYEIESGGGPPPPAEQERPQAPKLLD